MHSIAFRLQRTADMEALDAFPGAVDLIPDFFVSFLGALLILVSFPFAFDVEPGFFAFFGSGSSLEPSWSLALAFVFLRLLGFSPASGSSRAARFFEGEDTWSSDLSN